MCCVCMRGGAISQIYGNWNGRIFWGKCSQFDSAAKKGHPIQFALNGIRGATGKHLKANDLIKASQASPLTHCIKAICWLINKRIIFYLDFCARGRLVALGSGEGGCRCSVCASYPCRDFVSALSERFSVLRTFKCRMSMGCTCSSGGQTLRTSQAFCMLYEW